MDILNILEQKWKNVETPFIIHPSGNLFFKDILEAKTIDISDIKSGEVVALVGDFNPSSILLFLKLIEKKTIILPLTIDTKEQHEYFFETALVDIVIKDNSIKRINHKKKHKLIDYLRKQKKGGLILFSTGTTGSPKAILHDFNKFLKRFETPKPSLKMINFLLFDHIGGLNTLFHSLFNKGTVVSLTSRRVEEVLEVCSKYKVEVLPTTPTFLRMLLISELIPKKIPSSLKIITYGTERMDQNTLNQLCKLMPQVDFRQTYGMSEIGILRVKSKARNSLYIKIGGEGIKTRIKNDVLEIFSETRMLGYLNAESPFDNEGWYKTNDIVEVDNDYLKINGRTSEFINVGGVKFMASDIESVALEFEGIKLAKVEGKLNPITGQHVELTIQTIDGCDFKKIEFQKFLTSKLPKYMIPMKLKVEMININHRFKQN